VGLGEFGKTQITSQFTIPLAPELTSSLACEFWPILEMVEEIRSDEQQVHLLMTREDMLLENFKIASLFSQVADTALPLS